MSYSSHADLKRLLAEIDIYLSKLSSPVMVGTGLSGGITLTGSYVCDMDKFYKVEIDHAGAAADDPDTYKWSNDGGANWMESGVEVSTSSRLLECGIKMAFETPIFGRTLGNYWTFTATAAVSDSERAMAYDWLNDKLRGVMTVPITDPSNSVKQTEAAYAIFLILRANDVAGFYDFQTQADDLLCSLAKTALNGTARAKPTSATKGYQVEFSRGRYDADGNLLGRGVSGDGVKGSLDNW